MAEAYWDLEWALQEQGFDYCYDKRLYDRLVHDGAEAVQGHLNADLGYQRRLRPLHREPRRAARGGDVLPRAGTRRRRGDAEPDRGPARPRGAARGPQGPAAGLPRAPARRAARSRRARVLRPAAERARATASSATASGSSASDAAGTATRRGGISSVWGWRGDESRKLVVVNLGDAPASGDVSLPWDDFRGRTWQLDDAAERRGLRAERRRPPRRALRRARPLVVAPLRRDPTRLTGGLTDAELQHPGDGRARPARRGDRPRRGRSLLGEPVVRVGPVPERARLGHRPRGLLRGRQRLGVVPARSRALPRVSLERGRHGRHLGHPPRALPRPRALERRGPDPEGADVRAHGAAGKPRRGRQGVLVVPRGPAEPRAPALALPLPAGRLPVRRADPPRPWPPGSRARAARHRRVRRRPLLVGRRHLREGLADGDPRPHRGREPRGRGGDAGGAADAVVPQHVVVGRGCGAAAHRSRRLGARRLRSRARRLPARGGTRARRRAAGGAVLRERVERTARVRVGRDDAVPEGRHQRPRRLRRCDRQPGRVRHQGGVPLSADRACRRHRRAPAAPASPGRRHAGRGLGRPAVRRDGGRARGGCGGVLRRAGAGRDRAGADADPAPVVRRARLEQADLPLRRAPLAGRGSRSAAAAGGAQARAQQRLAPPRLVRRARDAGSVGVPVVRGLGSRLPHDSLGAPRPRVREVPADGAAARVVPAPERGAAGIRVELRRRQSAGARDGGDPRLPHRRRPRPRVPGADLPEAARQLHLVAEPRGRRRQQRLQRRLSRSRQHQPDRSLQPPGGGCARAGRRHRVDGVLRADDARDRDRARGGERRLPGHGGQVPRAVRPDRARTRASGPLRLGRRVLLRPARVPLGRQRAREGADDLRADPRAPGRRAADEGGRDRGRAGQALRPSPRALGGIRRGRDRPRAGGRRRADGSSSR